MHSPKKPWGKKPSTALFTSPRWDKLFPLKSLIVQEISAGGTDSSLSQFNSDLIFNFKSFGPDIFTLAGPTARNE